MDSTAPEGLDEEADEMTEAVLYEITAGLMGAAPTAGKTALPGTGVAAKPAAAATGRVAVAEGGAVGGAGASGGDVSSRFDRL